MAKKDQSKSQGIMSNYYKKASNDLKKLGAEYVQAMNAEIKDNIVQVAKTSMDTKYLSAVDGIPYQFLPNVDRRIKYKDLNNNLAEASVGRKYQEKIVDRMPLLFLMPCVAKFRSSSTNDQTLTAQVANAIGASMENIRNFLENDTENDNYTSRYYETNFAFSGYYDHLNTMLSTLATYMGIKDEKIYFNGALTKISDIDWGAQTAGIDDFAMYYSGRETGAVFYLDGFDTVSESFDNDTAKPSIASDFDSKSDEVRELRFLFGENADSAADLNYEISKIKTVLGNFTGGIESPSDILTGIDWTGLATTGYKYLKSDIYRDLLSNSDTTLYQGGRVLFPEIWTDSSYNRSYNLSIKLRSPDHDKVSIFVNLFVPYCKLLCLTLPHATSDVLAESMGKDEAYMDPNTYFSPFLIKAFSKGTINIDMGIIESISVSKGGTAQWTADGLPTQLDIDLSIKDLYHALAISGWKGTVLGETFANVSNTWRVVSNTAYMNFLANMAGLNVKDTHKRKFSLFLDLAESRFNHTGASLRTYADNYIANMVRDFYENL